METDLELKLLKYFVDKDNFRNYNLIGGAKIERLSSSIKDIITNLKDYIEDVNPESINLKDYSTWYCSIAHPNISDSKAQEIEAICSKVEQMPSIPPSDTIFKDLSTRQ